MGTVRACHKCEQYVEVRDSYEGQKIVQAFQKDHQGHPLGNLELSEVKSYTNVTNEYTKVDG